MEKEWLKRQIMPDELNAIEAAHMYKVKSDERITVANDVLPFGENYFTWRDMRRMCENDVPTDQLWEYDNDAWRQMAGRKGYCITRNGYMTGWVICTQMN